MLQLMIATPQRPLMPTDHRMMWTTPGVMAYGLSAMVLGAVGLAFGDFAGVWHPVRPGTPGRTALAYLAGVCLVAAGAAVQRRQFARGGVAVLGAFYLTMSLLWLPRVFGHPRIYGTWGGFFEQFSLVAAAVTVYGFLDRVKTAPRVAEIGRVLFGICVVSFALNHFFAIPETAGMVPKWLPPGQYFWAVATGIAHLLAALAILANVRAVLAARLLTLMLFSFGVFVWLPLLLARRGEHVPWAGTAINLVVTGAAWAVADYLATSRTAGVESQ